MFNIPDSNIPECLKDENRINVLFAPIRPRSVNSKDWDNKISSWKQIIKVYCESNDIYTFTFSSLNKVFIRNGRPPTCLLEVLNEMEKNGEIIPIEVFSKNNARTWTAWAANVLVKNPLFWSYNKLKNSMFTTDVSQKQFVHLEVIKSKSNDLVNSIPNNYKNKLISLKDLLTILNKSINTLEDLKLLLHYMSNQGLIDITNLNSNKQTEMETTMIKFGDGSSSIITELDIGIYTLEQNEKVILKSIEQMEDSIQSCVNEAKMHLSKNHRQMAKSSLRKKHDMEKILEKKANALHNVQTLLQQINETHTNAHVLESYKKVLSAFDFSYKDTGISEDIIDETMIQLGEVLDKNQDIQSALAQPAQDLDESDLEKELADLLKEDVPHDDPPNNSGLNTSDVEKKLNNMSLNLPEVPDTSPNVSQKELKITYQ